MSLLAAPIHIGAVGVANLRFFAPPVGKRHFPWVAVEDLHACLCLPRALRRELKTKLRSSQFAGDTRTVATAAGIVPLVPHYMAQGLIDAMVQVGQAGEGLQRQYAMEGTKAMQVLTLSLAPAEVTAYLGEAMKASGGPA